MDNNSAQFLKKQSAPGRYNSLSSTKSGGGEDSRKVPPSVVSTADFAHIRPRVDTGLVGLGLKKSNSAVRIREPFTLPAAAQKRSEPSVLPSQSRTGCGSTAGGPFKVPERPGGAFNRNSAQRQSLTRLFSRNGDKSKKSSSGGGSGGADVRTPFGETTGSAGSSRSGGGSETSQDRRSQFIKKRSITSLSLFSGGGGKKEEDHGGSSGRPEPVKVNRKTVLY